MVININQEFVHLHVHTDASLLDGMCTIPELVKRVKEMGQKAVAVTNHGNMSDVIDFYEQCTKNDIKPIIGVEMYLTPNRFDYSEALEAVEANKKEKKNLSAKEQKEYDKPVSTKEYFANLINTDRRYLAFAEYSQETRGNEIVNDVLYKSRHLILLAKNTQGYANLVKIATEAQLNGFYKYPRIDYDFLKNHSNGIICTSACIAGPISSLILNDEIDEAKNLALWFKETFEDFYLEIQPNYLEDQIYVNKILIELSKELNIPLIVSSDAHYIKKEDYETHCVLLAMQTKGIYGEEGTFKLPENSFYLHSRQELEEYGIPIEAIENTIEIANKCDLKLDLNVPQLPILEVPNGYTAQTWLEHISYQSLIEYLDKNPDLNQEEYMERLFFELDIIKQKDIAAYMLIVQDFINEMKKRGILIGEGRGSAVGSLVSFCTKITGLDPIKYDLLFERFLSIDRKELPDVDSDVMQFLTIKDCPQAEIFDIFKDGRKEVIEYFQSKYGLDKVCQVGTAGTEETRMILRDVGRVLNIPYQDIIELNKHIPSDAGKMWSLEDCLYGNEKEGYSPIQEVIDFGNRSEKHKMLLEMAMKLRGIKRSQGIHAGGVVITPQPVNEMFPLRNGKNGEIVTQYDKVDIEKAGGVKLDNPIMSSIKQVICWEWLRA